LDQFLIKRTRFYPYDASKEKRRQVKENWGFSVIARPKAVAIQGQQVWFYFT
jgi:hypothetical protein